MADERREERKREMLTVSQAVAREQTPEAVKVRCKKERKVESPGAKGRERETY